MNTYADKTQKEKSQSVANSVSQKKNNSESAFSFVDNRPESIAQRKLQEVANNSPRVSQLRAVQGIANNHSVNKMYTVQKKEDKSSIIQLNGNGKEDSGKQNKPPERAEAPNFNPSSFVQGMLQGPVAFFRAPATGVAEHFQLLLGGRPQERVQRIGQMSQVINPFLIANANSIREQAQRIYPQLPLPARQVIYDQGAFTLGSFIGSQITSFALGRAARTNPRLLLPYMLFSTTSKYFNMYYQFTNSGRFVENSASRCSDEIRKHFPPQR